MKLNISNTHIPGTCSTNASAVEQAQLQALLFLLPKVLVGTGTHVIGINRMVRDLLDKLSRLGRMVSDGELLTSRAVIAFEGHYFIAQVAAMDGTEFVTRIVFTRASGYGRAPLCPAIQLKYLARLIKALPNLSSFICSVCNGSSVPGDFEQLSRLASTSLNQLVLNDCGLVGKLPPQWAALKRLQEIRLGDNKITSTLPPSWAALGNLSSIDLSNSKLRGPLPDKWGRDKIMPEGMSLYVFANAQLTGSIPLSWAHFTSGSVYLRSTQVGGCLPDGLQVTHDKQLVPCSQVGPTAAALARLKGLLEAAGLGEGLGNSTWVTGGPKHMLALREHGESPTVMLTPQCICQVCLAVLVELSRATDGSKHMLTCVQGHPITSCGL
jgi:hypothetical protein